MIHFMEGFVESLKSTVDRLQHILLQYGISFCVMGGASLPYYGVSRTTDDIDILVAIQDKDKLQHLPPSYLRDVSNERGRVFMLEGKTKIEVIYTKDKLNG